ncbi:hypothetical protein Tco_0065789 [Tanacetum coccineum]
MFLRGVCVGLEKRGKREKFVILGYDHIEVDNEMASEDDDGVLDKLSLELSKVLGQNGFSAYVSAGSGSDGPIRHIHSEDDDGVLDKLSLELRSKVLGQNGFSTYVSAGSRFDGPIRHIHGYGYGVLKGWIRRIHSMDMAYPCHSGHSFWLFLF